MCRFKTQNSKARCQGLSIMFSESDAELAGSLAVLTGSAVHVDIMNVSVRYNGMAIII